MILSAGFAASAQTTVTIDSVVKTDQGNVVYYSYCTDKTGDAFYSFSGYVSAKSTRDRFKPFADVWCKPCMTLPCGAGEFLDGWTSNRKEERIYQIKVIENGTEPLEQRTFYSNVVTVLK